MNARSIHDENRLDTMNTYQNPASPIEDRIDDLLLRMELDEKIAQMHAV